MRSRYSRSPHLVVVPVLVTLRPCLGVAARGTGVDLILGTGGERLHGTGAARFTVDEIMEPFIDAALTIEGAVRMATS